MKEYILNILREEKTYRFKLFYKNGNFHRLERLSGFLPEKQYNSLMILVPQSECLLEGLAEHYMNRGVVYEHCFKTKSTHAQFIEAYTQWYYNRFQIEPIIKPQDAQAVKFIKDSLIKLGGSEEEAFTVWEMILNNWDKQETWYVSQTELTQIKRNLNTILKVLKHGRSTEQTVRQARNVSNDYRQNF